MSTYLIDVEIRYLCAQTTMFICFVYFIVKKGKENNLPKDLVRKKS